MATAHRSHDPSRTIAVQPNDSTITCGTSLSLLACTPLHARLGSRHSAWASLSTRAPAPLCTRLCSQLAESEPCFTFAHPNRDETIDNTRYHKMCFKLAAEAPATIHGIAGFFDCKLYGDVHISINPKNFSTGMWLPREQKRKEKACNVLNTNTHTTRSGFLGLAPTLPPPPAATLA